MDKMEQVRDEIKAIAKKYDVALVAMASHPEGAIYTLNMEASWNAIYWRNGELRIDTTNMKPEDKRQAIENSASTFLVFQQIGEDVSKVVTAGVDIISKHFDLCFVMKRNQRPPESENEG